MRSILRKSVNIKRLRPSAKVPTYETASSAGCDLYAAFDIPEDKEREKPCVAIHPGETVFIPTGIAMEIPEDCVGLIYARSGLGCKKGLAPANKVGVIDSDYRGEIMVALYNHGNKSQTIYNGDRIAQFILTPYYQAKYQVVPELSDTDRGDKGFGSTGTN